MKNSEILQHLNGLEAMTLREQRAMEHDIGYPKMNIRAVYKIFKNKQSLKNALEPYQVSLKILFNKYNISLNPDGSLNLDSIDADSRISLTGELNELLGMDEEVGLSKLTLDDFGDYEISQTDYETLEFMID